MAKKRIHYVADEGVKAAVEVARSLGMPLLVTGDPGTGKTQLAYWVAQQIRAEEARKNKTEPQTEDSDPRVLRFNTKTTSIARDLFYRFDAVGHFRAIHREKAGQPVDVNPFHHLVFEPLGKAILSGGQRQFVVLVDEIDKAPRDFPNDLLFEFEEMAFRIEEANAKDFESFENQFAQKPEFAELKLEIADPKPQQGIIRLPDKAPRPILILTSNSEKNLPDAFLRRCIFYHIPFPTDKALLEILEENASVSDEYKSLLEKVIKEFLQIREIGLQKKPSVAELIHWVEVLSQQKLNLEKMKTDAEASEKLQRTAAVLAKNKNDQDKLVGRFKSGV